VRIAIPVANTIELPMPWTTLNTISMEALAEMADRNDETVKITMPYVKTLFLPPISANLPKGTSDVAAASR